MKKYKISVAMNFWAIGGAENFYHRLAVKLPQYEWSFVTETDPKTDLIIYSNDHRFYIQANELDKPAILRLTGPRSYSLPQPEDLKYVICSSNKSFELSRHPNKVLIFNGIDFDHINGIEPIKCQYLTSEARIGIGQRIEDAIKYTITHKKHLTCLGSKQHLAEDTYDYLKNKYPQVNWVGLVEPDISLQYIKGCDALIIASKTHGISNSALEAIALNKTIINLGGVELPPKDQIDLNITAEKYNKLIIEVLNGSNT